MTGALTALAQTPAATAGLHGHVTDPSGALIPGAQVAIVTAAGATAATTTADASGRYQAKGLEPGKYTVQATSTGFAPFTSQPLQLAAGQQMQLNISLTVQVEQENVVVSSEAPTISVEASSNANSLVIKGTDLDALSDDPDELSNELSALAGPSAGPNGGQIYIDGFTGGELPPKSSIREIRINQNPYSAEFDKLGYGRIEILTKPGTDKLHGRFFAMGNDKSFNTGNPFTPNVPAYHSYQFNGTLNGSLSKKASFFISAERRNMQNANVYTAETGDNIFDNGALLNPRTRTNVSPRIDLQLGAKNTLTVRYQFYRDEDNDNLSSTIALPTQATSTTSTENTVQISDSQIISDRIVNETRFQYLRDTSSETPASTAPVVSVTSYFTGGGASTQQANSHIDHFELQNLTTMSLGAHAVKFGARLRDDREASSTNGGFNGSFSFATLNAYANAMAALGSSSFVTGLSANAQPQKLNYTTGPLANEANVFDAAVFVQDDWKVNKLLTISGGLRWESQNHISDHNDWAPRVALAYALDGHKSGKTKTVLRAGYGIFYDRFSLDNLLSATRHSGSANSQTQHTITNPVCFANIYVGNLSSSQLASCLAAGASTSTTQTIVQIAPNYHSPYTQQFGASLERQINKNSTITATYLHSFGVHQLVTRDSNAYEPGTFEYGSSTLTGVRPNPSLGIVEEFYPQAVFKQDQLIVNLNVKFTSNFNVAGFYNFTSAHTNGAGGTASNSYNLNQDYGRASFASRNMLFLMANYQGPWGMRFNPFLMAESGKPFNIVTNNDLTGDNFFNNRPAFAAASLCTTSSSATTPSHYAQTSYGCLNTEPGSIYTPIPVNLGNGPAAVSFNLRLSRSFGVGPKTASAKGMDGGAPPPPGGGPGGGGHGGSGGGPGGGGPGGGFGPGGFSGSGGRPPRGMFDSAASRKYSLSFSVEAMNLFNNINYGTPSGTVIPTLTSGSTIVGPGSRFGKSTSLAGKMFSSGSASRRIFLQAVFSF